MALTTGTRLGPYEIVAPLGAGGMGEVYRARDTKLNRDVALKLLPDLFAADSERLGRFQREAQVLASLNHPHIAQIYGLEDSGPSTGSGQAAIHAIVMELVEGQTLQARLAQVSSLKAEGSGLPLDEALTIARQVAEALEAAHEKGVIHRDLKPANVMITHGGLVKVLDFGLAAVAQGSGPADIDVTNSPTLTMAATRAGVILGTAAYMSPEQAAGKAVDKRADIWSFGVMLWEMLTGQRLFDGETVSHTLADVLRAEIDFNTLPSSTPPVIRDLLRRCLDRDTRNRLRDIGEARVAIQKYLANPTAAGVAAALPAGAVVRSSRLTAVAWGVAAVAVPCAAVLAFVHFRERPAIAEPVRFQILPPDQTTFTTTAVLSPDGR